MATILAKSAGHTKTSATPVTVRAPKSNMKAAIKIKIFTL